MSKAMRYRVRHQTSYQYGGDVAHSHQLLHLAPRDSATQICRSRTITLAPEPSTRREDVDAFGNFVTRLEYDLPHDHLEVLAEVEVEVRRPRTRRPRIPRPGRKCATRWRIRAGR
jgi:transglutaminase-like putative cysteine protease